MKKQISLGIILAFISQTITIIVGLIYTPIMIRLLGSSEYGLYQLVQSVVSYLSLMNFGFTGAYIRYYSLAKNENDNEVSKVNGMFMRIFVVIAFLCLLLGFILYRNISILGEKLSTSEYNHAKVLLIILVINLALSLPNNLFVSYMSANEKFVFQKAVGIVLGVLTPILNLILLLFGYGSIGLASSTLFFTIISLGINIKFCFKVLDMDIDIGYFNKQLFLSLLTYTFFIFLSDIVDQLNSNVDKFLLGRINGTVDVAIYSVAYNLKTYFVTLSWLVPEMFIPRVNMLSVESNKDAELTYVFTKVGRINNYVLLLVFTGFLLIGKTFIVLWLGDDYTQAYYATIVLMVASYIPAIQTLGVNIQTAKNMHKIRSIVYFVIACLNVVVSIFFIKKWGILGTCLGTLLSIIIGCVLFMNYYYHKYVKLNVIYFWKEILRWVVPVCILYTCTRIILMHIMISSWFGIIGFVGIYTLTYLIILWCVGLESTERKYILNRIHLIKKDFEL